LANRLFIDEILSVGGVVAGDNPLATISLFKSYEYDDGLSKRVFTPEQRRQLAEEGKALPDGSFPIVTKADLQNAVAAFGRAKAKTAAKRHIIKRAKALGATDILPDGWDVSKMTTRTESSLSGPGVNVDLSAIEDQDLRKSVQDVFDESETKISDLTKQVADLTPEEVDVVKDASDEVQALIAKQEADLENLSKELADERTARRNTEFVGKAEPYAGLLGKAEEMGPVLAELADAAPDAYEKLEGALTAASQRDDLAKLFSEMGAGEGEGETDPISKRDSWVEKNRKESESTEQANARFWNENPESVKESRS